MCLSQPKRANARYGAATIEFAVLLPLLMFLFGIGVDFARAFYAHLTIANAARNGALYGSSSPERSVDTTGIQAAATKDLKDLGGSATVTSSVVTVSGVSYLNVQVSYPFQSLTGFPGVPSTMTIWQTSEMRVLPTEPSPGTY